MPRQSAARVSLPLGSLTQRDARSEIECVTCGSVRLTTLTMNLTDGTPVEFTSCRQCGHRSWTHEGIELAVTDVLARSRKIS
jgi:ribosomal protein L37E